MSIDTPSPQIQNTFDTIRQHFGDTFSLEDLRIWVSKARGKPIIIRRKPLQRSAWGVVIELADAVVIYLRYGIPPLLEKMTCCHELAHVALGHLDVWNVTLDELEAQPELVELGLMRSDDLSNSDAYKASSLMVDAAADEDAESLGFLTLACVLRSEVAIPRLARTIFG